MGKVERFDYYLQGSMIYLLPVLISFYYAGLLGYISWSSGLYKLEFCTSVMISYFGFCRGLL